MATEIGRRIRNNTISHVPRGWSSLVKGLMSQVASIVSSLPVDYCPTRIMVYEKNGVMCSDIDHRIQDKGIAKELDLAVEYYKDRSRHTCYYCADWAKKDSICDKCMEFEELSRCDMDMDTSSKNVTMVELSNVYDGALFYYNTKTFKWKPRIHDLCIDHIETIHDFIKKEMEASCAGRNSQSLK